MKGKFVFRLLTFFIGLPFFVGLAFITPYNFLVFQLIVMLASVIASIELYNMLSKKLPLQPKWFSVSLPPLFCVLVTVSSFFSNIIETIPRMISFLLVFFVILIFIFEIFCTNHKNNTDFSSSLFAITGSILLLIYPGLFFSYISRLALVKNAQAGIVAFFLMVFSCDSAAWAIGMLFGKRNRGVIAVSPNKSIAGFIGAYLGTALAGYFVSLLFPSVFGRTFSHTMILACITATACIIGDLAESVLKRSVDTKDAGFVIPGRGGMLDSVDSMIFAAPFYYFFLEQLFIY